MRLDTMPDEWPEVALWVENTLEIPRCCPVSRNPQPGSRLTIRYRSRGCVLEVYALKEYISGYVGGHSDGTRNMEAMIQKIAQECANALRSSVRVCADLILLPYQTMRLVCRAKPDEVLSGYSSVTVVRPRESTAVRVSPPPSRAKEPADSDL
jgi:hypothetical protein